jgi:soluble lytic murein transglycosylase
VASRRIAYSVLVLLLLIMAGEIGYIFWQQHQPKENPYDPIIAAVAREDGVDPFLVRALIWRESRFNPETYGTAQEHGLMQVTPAVGEAWAKANKIINYGADDLYNPVVNVRAGTWYLSHAIRHWSQTDDPITFALAEYNAGRSNALKWVDPNDPQSHIAFLDRITFPSTQKYVETIEAKREEYRATLARNRWYRDSGSAASSVTLSP